jgi:hypothetical protein
MNLTLTDLASIAQVVGALAVVISLVYVALQVKSNSAAVRSASGTAANAAVQNWYMDLGSNQQISALYVRAMTSPEPLPRDEEFQFIVMTHALMLAFQNSYFLERERTIDVELREAMTVTILGVKDLPGFRRYWRQRRSYFLKGFADYADELLARPSVATLDVYRLPETIQLSSPR